MSLRTPTLSATRLTTNIGLEIDGLDLRSGADADTVGLLRTALAEHHVVMLREQFLSAEEHAVVARAFGRIQSSPVQLATRTVPSGGVVSTMAIQNASPAIDRGDGCLPGLPLFDARGDGYPRVLRFAPDLGAYEYAGLGHGDAIFANGFQIGC